MSQRLAQNLFLFTGGESPQNLKRLIFLAECKKNQPLKSLGTREKIKSQFFVERGGLATPLNKKLES